MKKYTYIIASWVALLSCLNCSTKKNAFLNRNWHALNTKYNVLYNGYMALDDGKKQLQDTYVDDYYSLLPVERMEISDQVYLPGEARNENFKRAEEKAVKAVQKHGMNIQGTEHNSQIDEAYLLLGEARYYDQRFIPALEAFNYILYRYPLSDKINTAKIWREKTNVRLENEEIAIANLKKLLKETRLKKQQIADASATMAQAYINLSYQDSAVQRLKIAANVTESNEERGRYNYIIGQLYTNLQQPDSANYAFQKVIDLNRRTARSYVINAYIEKIKNDSGDDKIALLKLINKLEKNRENKSFLGKIYREKAFYFIKQDSLALGRFYLNKSLRASQDVKLSSFDYEDLAQMDFDNHNYKAAGAYYDSTLTRLNKNTLRYRTIEKKRKNLDDVIKYEDIVTQTDSILHIVNLSEVDRRAYFQSYLDSINTLQKEEKIVNQNNFSGISNLPQDNLNNNITNNGNNTFYFYNPATVAYGKNQFRQRWGDRKLQDNWRFANTTAISKDAQTALDKTKTVATNQKDSITADDYLAQLPKTKTQIDSIKQARNFANYQLGILYKEKFKENELAAQKLENVLQHQPEEKLVLPAKYNLYKIYQELGWATQNKIKQDIITNYPNSRYAEVLQHPEAVIADDENAREKVYDSLYASFEAQKYEYVIQQSENYITQFNGDKIVPKFETLRAAAIGRLKGLKAYENALNAVLTNYPTSEEAKEVKQTLTTTIPKLMSLQFSDANENDTWKLVFEFKKDSTTNSNQFFTQVQQIIKGASRLKVSNDVYNSRENFVVIHGFATAEEAQDYAEMLKVQLNDLFDNENFVVSSSNYRIIQIKKNLENYKTIKSNQITNQ
ncbi:hypothetical protein ACG2LH_03260 [Zhouia sp. PK063]|uniref:type IX secretion system periplasmic lipoprotein PorW/SprE n=1 Tax=Zhouia sp. PK063 TaxID=3373602 RepID=UPI0037BAD47C